MYNMTFIFVMIECSYEHATINFNCYIDISMNAHMVINIARMIKITIILEKKGCIANFQSSIYLYIHILQEKMLAIILTIQEKIK